MVIHIMEYYSALQRKEILTHATIGVNLEDIMLLSEICQSQRERYFNSIYMRYWHSQTHKIACRMVVARSWEKEHGALPSSQGAGGRTSQNQTDRSSPKPTPRISLFRWKGRACREWASLQSCKAASPGFAASRYTSGDKEKGKFA